MLGVIIIFLSVKEELIPSSSKLYFGESAAETHLHTKMHVWAQRYKTAHTHTLEQEAVQAGCLGRGEAAAV